MFTLFDLILFSKLLETITIPLSHKQRELVFWSDVLVDVMVIIACGAPYYHS